MTDSTDFNPARLSFARRRRGWTKTALAKAMRVEMRSVSAYESGEFRPEDDRLRSAAEALRFPFEFFFGDDIDELSPHSASFRALTKMTAAQRNMALGAGAIALLLNKWINDRFELPTSDVPDLSREGGPEAAAHSLRRLWGLGELPIKNMIYLLEANGIRVYSLSIDVAAVDAFSMWRETTPFVFLNTHKSCERSRFDAAHELGHLVLHRQGAPQGIEAEREANAFASAFLMPRASVLAAAPRFASVSQLISLKKYWTVSVAALAYRLRTVNLVSDWHYRTLCMEISSRFRTQEPEGAPRETSQVLAKVFAALREDGVTKAHIARELSVSVDEIDELVFGLALTALASTGTPRTPSDRKRPQLRIVSGNS